MNEKKSLSAIAIKKTSEEYSARYDSDYYERGLVCGISGYMNYGWMPELTIRMAHFMIKNLPINENEKVLDYGCAKGFMVKAFRLLGVDCYGCDISSYAISKVENELKEYCWKISDTIDQYTFKQDYDWMIAKDVFEHIPELELRQLLLKAHGKIKNIFVVVPLAENDYIGKYIIPDYDKDVTHLIAKSLSWWESFFIDTGWQISNSQYSFEGCKENWTQIYPKGNAFITIKSV